jgi:ribosome-associated toxin RatA of RatAB toxin-antitoxin module
MAFARLVSVLVLLLVALGDARAASVSVVAFREGEAVVVEASAELSAAPELAWQTVTDYGALADFIPDLELSRVISRDGRRVRVEQKGTAALLLLKRTFEVHLDIEEEPFRTVTSRAVAGSFRRMVGRYELTPTPQGTRFAYTGTIEPDFWVPAFLETAAVRRAVARQFQAMVSEIERRAGAIARGGR